VVLLQRLQLYFETFNVALQSVALLRVLVFLHAFGGTRFVEFGELRFERGSLELKFGLLDCMTFSEK
jgi:hypothetical protein